MDFVFLDMEWNQPFGKANMVQKPITLVGEVIRIGAVKINEQSEICDHHYGFVLPKYYKKMNYAVGKVTGLATRSITYGVKFPDEFRTFESWCGDCVILTWGGEDEKILRANMTLHKISTDKLPKFYDLQQIFAKKIVCDCKQHSLQSALEYYDLPRDLKAHDALNDAIYAARVAIKMNFFDYLADYDKMIVENQKKKAEKFSHTYVGMPSIEEIFASKKIMCFKCPHCKKFMKREELTPISDKTIISAAKCSEHGEFLVRIKIKECRDKTYSVTRHLTEMTDDYKKYYNTVTEAEPTQL